MTEVPLEESFNVNNVEKNTGKPSETGSICNWYLMTLFLGQALVKMNFK